MKPEAYVPLPDGRTIPVTVSGAVSGGGTQVNIEVHVHSDGTTKTTSDASGAEAAQLGKLVEAAVMGVIVREKRAGGQLASVS